MSGRYDIMAWLTEMKARDVRVALSVSAVCLWVHMAPVTAPAVGRGQSASDSPSAIARVYSIIRQESGISSSEPSPLPVVKRDRTGKIWAAWEKWDMDRCQIRLASFGSAGIESIFTVGLAEGSDLSPDLAFSADGQPWVTWLNSDGSKTTVQVIDVTGQRIWRLGGESTASLAGPRIVMDARGEAWVFWNATTGMTGEITYRVLQGPTWTPPASVPRSTAWPALNPDAGIDRGGTLWLTWSGYDGSGYRIYLTHWTEAGWTPENAVSVSQGANLFPALGFDAQDDPLVSWIRAGDRRRAVCLTSWKGGRATGETVLETEADWPGPPRFIQEDGQASLILKSGDGLRVESVSQALGAGRPSTSPLPPAPRLLDNPQFDENKYAGVGDSITFGYVDYYPYPERGYIPLLNAILNAHYGSQRVINEGFGGEVTAEGLVRIEKVFIADLARYILIMEGTNDVVFNYISIDSTAFNLREMVRKCLAVGALPAIATIVPRYDFYGTQAFFRDRLLSLNAKIRQIAADLAVPLVDMYSAFASYPAADGGVLSLLSKDLKHPSDKGYQFMAETWFSEIRNFPFPPVNLSIETFGPGRQERTRARTPGSSRTSRPVRVDPRQPYGILLRWNQSPKIFDAGKVLGYRIYRKKSTGTAASFELLAFVQQPLEFFNRGLAAVGNFRYAISTLRQDGIEGALSDAIGK